MRCWNVMLADSSFSDITALVFAEDEAMARVEAEKMYPGWLAHTAKRNTGCPICARVLH